MSCPGYDRHPGQLAESGTDVALQERPAGQDPGYAAVLLAEPVSGQLPTPGSGGVAADSAVRGHLLQEPGEQVVEHLGAAGVQDMQVPALRHAPTVLPDCRHGVAVHDRDPRVGLCQHPRRQQPRHARAQDHGMVTARIADGHPAPLSRPARLSGSSGVVPEPILVLGHRPGKRAVDEAERRPGARGWISSRLVRGGDGHTVAAALSASVASTSDPSRPT
jgi:hypothetical protein